MMLMHMHMRSHDTGDDGDDDDDDDDEEEDRVGRGSKTVGGWERYEGDKDKDKNREKEKDKDRKKKKKKKSGESSRVRSAVGDTICVRVPQQPLPSTELSSFSRQEGGSRNTNGDVDGGERASGISTRGMVLGPRTKSKRRRTLER